MLFCLVDTANWTLGLSSKVITGLTYCILYFSCYVVKGNEQEALYQGFTLSGIQDHIYAVSWVQTSP